MDIGKIHILIVDDAVAMRQFLSKALSSDPALAVVGVAANGRIALAKIPQLNPDLVVLDVEMPEMNGLETLAAIRKTYPSLPVIMFSALTERGAAVTLDALALGANDYVTKPANMGGLQDSLGYIREQLIPKIKVFCCRDADPTASITHATPLPTTPWLPPVPLASRRRVDIVAIGASTGGPDALAALLPCLPAEFPVPIVIVQHMPPIFTRHLAGRLRSKAALCVGEASTGETLRPGQVWLAPGDFHMVLEQQGRDIRLKLHQAPPENSCRPAVDVLFRSVVGVYGARTLAVVMTGMGQDGLRGCQQIRAAGGQILVQDEASSVVWGMPGTVAKTGLADRVLPLPQLADEIVSRVWTGRQAERRAAPARMGQNSFRSS
jgi:two-component system chemotaxis response regulator CheB